MRSRRAVRYGSLRYSEHEAGQARLVFSAQRALLLKSLARVAPPVFGQVAPAIWLANMTPIRSGRATLFAPTASSAKTAVFGLSVSSLSDASSA